MSFSNFYKDIDNTIKNPDNDTPNTRVHHQKTGPRPITRQHQNLVARRYGIDGKKDDPIIDNIVKNKKIGIWPITSASGKRILSTYGIKHQTKDYLKAIKNTGIDIKFDSQKNKFYLIKNKKASK